MFCLRIDELLFRFRIEHCVCLGIAKGIKFVTVSAWFVARQSTVVCLVILAVESWETFSESQRCSFLERVFTRRPIP